MNHYIARTLRPGVCGIKRVSLYDTDVGSLALPSITIVDAIPGFNGLIPVSKLGEDLKITLPWWDGITERYYLQLAWKRFTEEDPNEPDDSYLVGDERQITPEEANDPNTIFNLAIPEALLMEGTYLVRMHVESPVGGNFDWSPTTSVIIDITPPGGTSLPPLQFENNVERSGEITDADIDINDKLPAAIAHYEEIARGDTIQPYVGTTAVTPEELTEDPGENPTRIALFYPKAALEAAGNGAKAFYYTVTDKAGNKAESFHQFFDVQLNTRPTLIPAPRVPQADPDFLDDAEARAGTLVEITPYDRAMEGDEILVHWGSSTPSNRSRLVPADLGRNPFITVSLPYGLVAGENSLGDVDVTFEVFRRGSSIGISQINTVKVDLTLPGGPDPDPETPEMDNLLPLVVKSASSGSPENVIPPGDYGQNASVEIPWLDDNGNGVYEPDDSIRVTWGAQIATPIIYVVQSGDTAIPSLTVPGATITAEGSGQAIPVGYTITRDTSFPGGSNTAIAFPTPVQVTGPNVLPGGGTIDKVVFPVLNNRNNIGLAQLIGGPGPLYNPITTNVAYQNVAIGDSVQLHFTGFDAYEGGSPIPGALYEPLHVIESADLAAGTYEFRVPAYYYFLICIDGRAEAYVTFTNGSGAANSDPVAVLVDVKVPSEPDCSSNLT